MLFVAAALFSFLEFRVVKNMYIWCGFLMNLCFVMNFE
jgi:hypothetical protein